MGENNYYTYCEDLELLLLLLLWLSYKKKGEGGERVRDIGRERELWDIRVGGGQYSILL